MKKARRDYSRYSPEHGEYLKRLDEAREKLCAVLRKEKVLVTRYQQLRDESGYSLPALQFECRNFAKKHKVRLKDVTIGASLDQEYNGYGYNHDFVLVLSCKTPRTEAEILTKAIALLSDQSSRNSMANDFVTKYGFDWPIKN